MAPVPIHFESAQLARASLESSVLTHEHLSLSLSLSLSVDCRYCQAPFGEYTPWSIISVSACGGGSVLFLYYQLSSRLSDVSSGVV